MCGTAGGGRAGWSMAVLVVFAGSLLFELEEYKLLPSHQCTYQQEQHDSEFERRLYGPIVHAHGFFVRHLRRAGAAQVAVVTISSPSEPLEVMNNTCKGRRYTASLVRALDAAGAKVIAIDKFYADGSCTDEGDNKPFLMALRCTRAPVIVGEATDATSSKSDAKQDCLVPVKPFAFNNRGYPGHDVQLGLTRLNVNSLKVPLAWYVWSPETKAEVPEPGLALLVAEAANHDLRTDRQMRWALGDLKLREPNQGAPTVIRHPIGAFIDIEPVHASDVLQAYKEYRETDDRALLDAHGCPTSLPVKTLPGITGKAVIVGQLSDGDLQATPEGVKPGMELQASYVSNLLEHQILRTVPRWCEIVLLGLFILVTYVAELHFEGEAGSLRWWCGGFVILVLFSMVMFAFGYMTPAFLSVSWLLFALILLRVFSELRNYSAKRAGL